MKSNTIILIIIGILLAGGIYWYFFTGTGNQAPLTAALPTQNVAQTQFQDLVSKLQPISFNTAIFSNPKFMALTNLTTPIAPEPIGRPDPFASVPGVTGM